MSAISISIKKLASYCLDYAKLTTSAVLSKAVTSPIIDKGVLDVSTLILNGLTSDSADVVDLDLLLKLDFNLPTDEKTEIKKAQEARHYTDFAIATSLDDTDLPLKLDFKLPTDEISEIKKAQEARYNKDFAIATSLDDINRKYLTSSYTKQIVLQTAYITFRAKPIIGGTDYVQVKSPLISIPISINTVDKGGTRQYSFELRDDAVTIVINSLSKYLPQPAYDEIFSFIAKSEGAGRNSIPLDKIFLDELWSKIVFNLRKVNAIDIVDAPNLDFSFVNLVQKSNYFLSQDLLVMNDFTDEDLLDTSLSAWESGDEMSLSSEVSDNGTNELFFPFPYDKHQVNVLSVVENRSIIVEGPPGTGKSQTIANLLVHFAAEGKKVLLVSQKDQAVRGVKESLKSLRIPFLFGYIPDRLSPLHTEEDEQDSAANTLIALNRHWDLVGERDPINPLKKLSRQKTSFVNGIESERTLYQLYIKRRELDYIAEYYEKPVSEQWWNDVQEIQKQINDVQGYVADFYATNTLFVNQKTNDYKILNLSSYRDYTRIGNILREVEIIFQNTVPERPSLLTKPLKAMQLKALLHRKTSNLQTEIWRDIEVVLESQVTKTERIVTLRQLGDYFEYESKRWVLLSSQHDLEEKLNTAQVALDQLYRFTTITATNGAEKVFADIKLFADIQKRIDDVENFSANELRQDIANVKKEYKSNVIDFVRNRILRRVEELRLEKDNRAVLARVAKSLTKSKKAYKTFDKLKSDDGNFDIMSQVLPIWMMSLEDASRILPMQKNLFDYVILDEASQCNIAYALPVMFRTKHTLFFGDSLQMRDNNTLFKTNENLKAIAEKHNISDFYAIKSEEESVKSVMDIATLAGFKNIPLLKHYRSPKELIGFSNKYFYEKIGRPLQVVNDNIFTYKDTNRVMVNHVVAYDPSVEESEKTNASEAYYIRDLINDLRADSKYDNKSIAVLTFFNEQAELLRKIIKDDDIKISTIEGIQGDERDVIIYSFVISSPHEKSRYVRASGEGGEVNKDLAEGRVNVAFSRARLQVHCVTSLSPELWPDGIWIKRYLEYVDKFGQASDRHDSAAQQFDSLFEQRVFDALGEKLNANQYYLSTQVKSCGFLIDLVITDKATNKKLAIECDGPTHFEAGDGQVYVQDDFERQNVLEIAGWTFYRISFFDWETDSTDELKCLLKAIEQHFNVQVQ